MEERRVMLKDKLEFEDAVKELRLEALHFANTKVGEQFLRAAIERFDKAMEKAPSSSRLPR